MAEPQMSTSVTAGPMDTKGDPQTRQGAAPAPQNLPPQLLPRAGMCRWLSPCRTGLPPGNNGIFTSNKNLPADYKNLCSPLKSIWLQSKLQPLFFGWNLSEGWEGKGTGGQRPSRVSSHGDEELTPRGSTAPKAERLGLHVGSSQSEV